LAQLSPSEGLPEGVHGYIREAISSNTRRAYNADLEHFAAWGGTIPCSPDVVAAYLAQHAHVFAVATLRRRVAAISTAHQARGLPNPAGTKVVQATMRGIARTHGKPQRRVKPLLLEDLMSIMASLGDGIRDARDRALLLVGFAGAFRRSELVSLDVADVEHVREGIVVTLARSKTDQEGEGRRIGIPFARRKHCPVRALEAWLERTGINEGPIIRPVDRHGRLLPTRLSPEAVAVIVKGRAAQVGLDPILYSGHSLRAGLATSAAAAGVSTLAIRRQTGHKSDAMLARYVRQGTLFENNAAGAIL
jgi:integrase